MRRPRGRRMKKTRRSLKIIGWGEMIPERKGRSRL
jgi:hypothetical protein